MRDVSAFHHNLFFRPSTWHAGDVVEWDWFISTFPVRYPLWRWTGEMQIAWDPESFGGAAAPTYYEAPAYEEILQSEFAYLTAAPGSPLTALWSVLDFAGGLSYWWAVTSSNGTNTWDTAEVDLAPVVVTPDARLTVPSAGYTVRWDIEDLGIRTSFVFGEQGWAADTSFVTQEWAAGLDTPFDAVWGTSPWTPAGIRRLQDDDLDGTWDTYSWASSHTGGLLRSRDLTHFEFEVGRLEFLSSYEETAAYVESLLGNVELELRREDLSERVEQVLAEFQEVDYDNVNDLSEQVESWTRYLADPEIMVDG